MQAIDNQWLFRLDNYYNAMHKLILYKTNQNHTVHTVSFIYLQTNSLFCQLNTFLVKRI